MNVFGFSSVVWSLVVKLSFVRSIVDIIIIYCFYYVIVDDDNKNDLFLEYGKWYIVKLRFVIKSFLKWMVDWIVVNDIMVLSY